VQHISNVYRNAGQVVVGLALDPRVDGDLRMETLPLFFSTNERF
jgi:hypothetical protein